MLITAKSLGDISFSQLMEVYAESNQENGREFWPEETPGQQLLQVEQSFLQYLREDFFRAGGVYYIWQVENRYVSALRIEPYRDGLLLEALETAPSQRRRGYAEVLMRCALERRGGEKIYSHVSKRNVPSLAVHKKCGFAPILDYAVYVDGSVNHKCCTMCRQG